MLEESRDLADPVTFLALWRKARLQLEDKLNILDAELLDVVKNRESTHFISSSSLPPFPPRLKPVTKRK